MLPSAAARRSGDNAYNLKRQAMTGRPRGAHLGVRCMLGHLFSSFAIDNSLATVVIFSLAGLDTSLWALSRFFDRLPDVLLLLAL